MQQGKTEDAYEKLEDVVFSTYTTLNLTFGTMITQALEEKNHEYAKYLAKKSECFSQCI